MERDVEITTTGGEPTPGLEVHKIMDRTVYIQLEEIKDEDRLDIPLPLFVDDKNEKLIVSRLVQADKGSSPDIKEAPQLQCQLLNFESIADEATRIGLIELIQNKHEKGRITAIMTIKHDKNHTGNVGFTLKKGDVINL